MTTAISNCSHGVNRYERACGSCEYEDRQFKAADAAYKSVSHEINGGGEPRIMGAVFGAEHPYLLSKLVSGVAMGVITRTYDRLCTATGTIFADEPHPDHDGRLSCGDTIGALRILGIARDTADVLAAVRYWRDRVYDRGY